MKGVYYMQEGHMANCLEIAFKHNIPKQQRKARVAKSPDWQIMDKSWRSILTIALDEVEIPGDDEDNNTSRPNRMMRRRGRGSAGKSSLDWLPSSEEITSDSSETAAYRLAVLLINSSIRLSIYNKRLIIKTMQLVGATKSFIRRPFIKTHLFMGFVGAIIALVCLGILIYEMDNYFPELKILENPVEPALIFTAILALGLGITLISTFFATQRYLNLKSDAIY